MRKKENILYDLVRIASRASEDLDDNEKGALIRDDVVEPLYLVARQLKTKGFVKISQTPGLAEQIAAQAQPGDGGGIDGGAITPDAAAEVSGNAAQAVNNQLQQGTRELQLSGPTIDIKLQIAGPRGMSPDEFGQKLEHLTQVLQKQYGEGWTFIIEGSGANKVKAV